MINVNEKESDYTQKQDDLNKKIPTAWEKALNQLNNTDSMTQKQRQEKIQQLFQSWNELDDENEQKETFKIIESLERVSF